MANVTKDFKGIPIQYLIGAPLQAACESQTMLAQAMVDFVNDIGFDDDGKTRLIKFDLERPVQTDNGMTTEQFKVEAPLLGLVPIPALLIDTVTVDFTMEVTSSVQKTASTDTESEVKVDAKLGMWGNANMSGKVSTHRENTRSTDKTAKYEFHVEAHQQPPTEGMSKLMDLLASTIEPLDGTTGNAA
jgi:hypothetical protein